MVFTDDDLKRLHAEYDLMGSEKIDALIVRLKAAENVIRYLVHIPDEFEKQSGGCAHCKAMDAWLRAKG